MKGKKLTEALLIDELDLREMRLRRTRVNQWSS